MLQIKAQTKNLQVVVHRSEFVPQYVQADEQKLRQVLINLLANGVKFTHQGEITLKIDYDRQKPHQISFKVQDTGDGIAPEEIPSLFTPFVQTQTGRRSQSGTGLGLSICHQYVQLMGGKIEVDSHLNKGSTFSFDIQIEIGKPRCLSSKISQGNWFTAKSTHTQNFSYRRPFGKSSIFSSTIRISGV